MRGKRICSAEAVLMKLAGLLNEGYTVLIDQSNKRKVKKMRNLLGLCLRHWYDRGLTVSATAGAAQIAKVR